MSVHLHPIDVEIGLRLKSLRVTNRKSQAALAAALGLSFQQIQKYEKGSNRITVRRLLEISDILGVCPGYFFEGLESAASVAGATPDWKSLQTAAMIAEIPDQGLRNSLYTLVKQLADGIDPKRATTAPAGRDEDDL